MTRLDAAVAETARTLDGLAIPYMVIGGMAVTVWGEPRLTQDVDVTIQCDPGDEPMLGRLVEAFRSRSLDPTSFVRATRVFPAVTTSGVSVDLIFAGLPFELTAIARSVSLEIGGYLVRVCAPEDLIVMKIISERPRDREDVRSVVRRQRDALDRAYLDPIVAQLAEALAQPDILGFYESLWRT